jgi:hypothetical protein
VELEQPVQIKRLRLVRLLVQHGAVESLGFWIARGLLVLDGGNQRLGDGLHGRPWIRIQPRRSLL